MATKKKRTPNAHNDSWVVIAADSVIDTQKHDCDPDFVKLRNPSTGSNVFTVNQISSPALMVNFVLVYKFKMM
ncbi:hypothetical protein AMECASPLE_035673, partial [Ameca splendens]